VNNEGEIFQEIPRDRLALLSREELILLAQSSGKYLRELKEEKLQLLAENVRLEKKTEFLEALAAELVEKYILITDQYIHIKNKIFKKSSERSAKQPSSNTPPDGPKQKKPKVQLPSERYPHACVIEREVSLQELPE
jgi:hypothetical protein